jgi:hypothetical protein
MPRFRTIAEIRRELRQKEAQVGYLMARRAKALARLAKIDRAIRAMGGEAPAAVKKGMGAGPRPGRRGRRRGGKPLIEYVRKALGKATGGMRVKEVQQVVRNAGYRTAAKDFYGIVATTLRDGRFFQKVRRGVYKLKG